MNRIWLGSGIVALVVVLFGTVAQTIDWSGDGELFLTVTDTNRKRFSDALVRYLGRAVPDDGAFIHEALRTLFVPSEQGYLQVVLSRFEPAWNIRNASVDEVPALCQEALIGEWNLEEAPSCYFELLYHPNNQCTLVWNIHHAATDGWSMASLVREFSRVYEALAAGIGAEPTMEAPYRNYVSWFQKQDKQASATYFSNLLGVVDEPSLLVPNYSPSKSLPRYDNLETRLDEEKTSALERFTRGRGLTISTVVQGAWALLLMHYLDRDDVCYGVTSSGRPPSLENVDFMIGMFINTLPLRATCGQGMGMEDWLRSLQEQQVDSREFDYTPLVDIQRHSGVASGNLFDSLVVFENYPIDESLQSNFAGLGLDDLGGFGQTNYPITLTSAPESRLPIMLTYDSELFESAFIQRLAGHLANLLGGIADDPNGDPLRIPIMDEEERRNILAWAGNETAYPRDSAIHQLFVEQATRDPQAVALVFDNNSWSYTQLLARHGVA